MLDPKDLVPGDQFYDEYHQDVFTDYIIHDQEYKEFSTRFFGRDHKETEKYKNLDLNYVQIEEVKQVDEYDKDMANKKRKKETDETLNLIASFFKNNPTIKKEEQSLKKEEQRRVLTEEEKEIADHKKKQEKNKAKDARLKKVMDTLTSENKSKTGASFKEPLTDRSNKKQLLSSEKKQLFSPEKKQDLFHGDFQLRRLNEIEKEIDKIDNCNKKPFETPQKVSNVTNTKDIVLLSPLKVESSKASPPRFRPKRASTYTTNSFENVLLSYGGLFDDDVKKDKDLDGYYVRQGNKVKASLMIKSVGGLFGMQDYDAKYIEANPMMESDDQLLSIGCMVIDKIGQQTYIPLNNRADTESTLVYVGGLFKNSQNEIYFKSLEFGIVKNPIMSPGRHTYSPGKMGSPKKVENKNQGWIWKAQKYTEFQFEKNYLYQDNYNYQSIQQRKEDQKKSPSKYNSPKKSPKKISLFQN